MPGRNDKKSEAGRAAAAVAAAAARQRHAVDRQSCRRLTQRRVQCNGVLNELTYAPSTCLRLCVASLYIVNNF